MGNGAAVSSSHFVSAAPSSSHSVPAPAWVPPTGRSPSGTGCSRVGPHRVTSPASKPALAWAPLSTGPQVLAGACSSTGLPTGSQLPSGIPLLWCWVLHGLQVGICSSWSAPWLQGQPAPQLQWNLYSSPWITSCPPSALTWGLQSCYSHIVSLFSPAAICAGFPLPPPS